MAKKIKTLVKLNIPAGSATPAPPVGPALGQHGLPIMEFVKAFNDRTANMKGTILPVVITVFEDRTFTFITKQPPIAEMIKKAIGKEKGSGKPGKEMAGIISLEQAKKIAQQKLEDLNTGNVDAELKL
jgi:large subunit ribosomal protein L11